MTPTFPKFGASGHPGAIHFGNASHWADAARAAGITVDQTPTVGAIAQSLHGGSGLGHVAYITAINPDHTFNIAESNYVHRHVFGTRSHVKLGADFTKFCTSRSEDIMRPRS